MHRHTSTCAKGGCKGDDIDCRVRMPQLAQWEGRADTDATILFKKSHHAMVAAGNQALMLAAPCNRAFYCAHDGSRFARKVDLWERAGRQGVAPSNAAVGRATGALNANYKIKYTVKETDTHTNHGMMLRVAEFGRRVARCWQQAG